MAKLACTVKEWCLSHLLIVVWYVIRHKITSLGLSEAVLDSGF
jgi:hypothetical protein